MTAIALRDSPKAMLEASTTLTGVGITNCSALRDPDSPFDFEEEFKAIFLRLECDPN